jgi:DNA-binding response OmpR family regulator
MRGAFRRKDTAQPCAETKVSLDSSLERCRATRQQQEIVAAKLKTWENGQMKKILLIFEDIQEGDQFKADLQKVGFDVLVTKTVNRLNDTLLSFNPDVIVGCGAHKFSSLSIGQKLKEEQAYVKGRIILLLPKGEKPSAPEIAKARVDILMETPLKPTQFLEVVARFADLDPAIIVDKFQKSQIQEHATPPQARLSKDSFEADRTAFTVKGSKTESSKILIEDKKRTEGYKKFVQDIHIDPKQTSHSKAQVKARQEVIKKDWDKEALKELDKQRKEFAEALFKKNT